MPDPSASFHALDQAVEQAFDDQIALLEALVRVPSTRGNERPAQAIMRAAMAQDSAQIDEFNVDIERIQHLPGFSPVTVDYHDMVNVVGRYGNAEGNGRSLILNGHIDVVPEGPLSGWASPPYEPRIADNKLYGRGSSDMKAGLTAKVFALRAIHSLGLRPNAPVYLQSVVEEECTGNGALACLEAGYTADAALIGEPFNDCLVTSQLGVIWFQVTLSGEPVHAERATSGVNAIDAMLPVIAALRELEANWNAQKHAHADYAEHAHPIHLNIAEFHAGDWTSSVPAWATLNVRIAVYPGDDLAVRQAEIEAHIDALKARNPLVARARPKIIYHGFLAEGYRLQPDTQAEQLLAAQHAEVTQSTLKRLAITATTDARFFGLYQDTPALVYGPTGNGYHGFDEYVELESLRRITQVYARFIADWCGLERRA